MIYALVVGSVLLAAAWYWRAPLNTWLDKFKGWRTIVVNAVPALTISIGEIAAFIAAFEMWDQFFSARTVALIMLVSNVINIGLRFKTDTPVGEV